MSLNFSKVDTALANEKYIICTTKEQTRDVTNMLLALGYGHGDSGYSKRYARGDIRDEVYASGCRMWYSNPCVIGNGIEYNANETIGTIPYESFVEYYYERIGCSADDINVDVQQLFDMI